MIPTSDICRLELLHRMDEKLPAEPDANGSLPDTRGSVIYSECLTEMVQNVP